MAARRALLRLSAGLAAAAAALASAACVSLVDRETLAAGDCVVTRVRLLTVHFDMGSPLRVYETRTQPNEKLGLLQLWSVAEPTKAGATCYTPGASGDPFLDRALALHAQALKDQERLLKILGPYVPAEELPFTFKAPLPESEATGDAGAASGAESPGTE